MREDICVEFQKKHINPISRKGLKLCLLLYVTPSNYRLYRRMHHKDALSAEPTEPTQLLIINLDKLYPLVI